MSRSILILPALALISATLFLGCGSSQDATSSAAQSTESGPLTKAEFIKKADAVCAKIDTDEYNEARKYRAEHKKELAPLEGIPREEILLRVIALPSILRQAEGIEALGAPKGEEKKVKAIVAEIRAGVKKARKDPYKIEEPGRLTENPFYDVDVQAREYGFTNCRNFS